VKPGGANFLPTSGGPQGANLRSAMHHIALPILTGIYVDFTTNTRVGQLQIVPPEFWVMSSEPTGTTQPHATAV
jgi:hypothetical protein